MTIISNFCSYFWVWIIPYIMYKYNAIWWIGFRLFEHFTDMLGTQNECLAWIIVWGFEKSMKWRQKILETKNMKESLLWKRIYFTKTSGDFFLKLNFRYWRLQSSFPASFVHPCYNFVCVCVILNSISISVL